MVWSRSHQISDTALQELKSSGLDPVCFAALEARKSTQVYRRREFQQVLDTLGPRRPEPQERAVIFKATQLSLLRLERFIRDRWTREWVEALVFALAIALVVRTFVIAPFKIPSASMAPTIEVGDHIFATMFSYGIRVPFTDFKLLQSPVERGQIVIFPFPRDPSVDYIKRVVAVGGDTLELRDRKLYVNGELQDEPFAFYDPTTSGSEDYGPRKIPEGMLFVMGDNRNHSFDSRRWNYVDEATIIGRGRIIYWSHDPNAGWLSGYRLERIASLLR